jgi:hypothetical protein
LFLRHYKFGASSPDNLLWEAAKFSTNGEEPNQPDFAVSMFSPGCVMELIYTHFLVKVNTIRINALAELESIYGDDVGIELDKTFADSFVKLFAISSLMRLAVVTRVFNDVSLPPANTQDVAAYRHNQDMVVMSSANSCEATREPAYPDWVSTVSADSDEDIGAYITMIRFASGVCWYLVDVA